VKEAGGIEIGEPAPPFELPDTDGEIHRFGDPSPDVRATVVYWTCNHCPYALAWQERLHQVARDYSGERVRFLAINSNDGSRYPADSAEAMSERVDREGGWPNPYLHDADQAVARSFGAERTPDVFVFDRDLRLRYRGAPDEDYNDASRNAAWLREALDSLLTGGAPSRPRTESVGCTIKWSAKGH
jgi:peroxiredoxin